MEIKKGNRFVCVKDVVMVNPKGQISYIKGNVYESEKYRCITDELGNKSHLWWDDGEANYFIPYSKLDRVYTKYTEMLEKLFDAYDGKKAGVSNGNHFDNVVGNDTGYFCQTSLITDKGYEQYGYTYLSEQAFIEYMDLGKYNVHTEGFTKKELEIVSEVIDKCIYGEEPSRPEFEEDMVNKPSHYNNGSIEPIDYIIANSMNFLEGNVVKYVTRYKFKNGLEDLKKAEFYLKKLIEGYGKD